MPLPRNTWRGKKLFHLIAYSSSGREGRAVTWRQELSTDPGKSATY